MSAPAFGAAFAAELEKLLGWRRDVRHFDPARPVAEADMRDLLRLACLSPSVGNAQPWRFVRLRSPALRETLAAHVDAQSRQAAARYDPARRAEYLALKLHGLREAPGLLAIFCDDRTADGHALGIATMPEMLRYSTAMAIHTLWLAARARGIGMGWVSIVDPVYVAGLLDAPPGWAFMALLCIGYPDAETGVPELERAGWQARIPWTDAVFER